MTRLLLHAIFCTALLAGQGPALSQDSESSAARRTLDWQDLVPADWDAPVIAIAHDAVAADAVDPKALVAALDEQQIRLPGFMRPVVFQQRSVSEFLLVPYLPHHLKQHAHLEANQMVYVLTEEPVEVDNPLTPIWVTGKLQLQTVATDEGPAGYRISGAHVTEYVY